MIESQNFPTLSVIVPAYNPSIDLFESLIDSILGQDFGSFEVIIIDDGSDASIRNQIDELANRDVRLRVLHVPHGGVSAARNKGLQEVRGKYVTFADADDEVAPGFFSSAISLLEESGADAVFGGKTQVYKDGVVNRVGVDCPRVMFFEGASLDLLRKFAVGMEPPKELRCYAGFSIAALHAKVFRISAIGDNRFNERQTIGEDSFFNALVIGSCSRVGITSDIWYHYFQRSGSAVHGDAASINSSMTNIELHAHAARDCGWNMGAVGVRCAFVAITILGQAACVTSFCSLVGIIANAMNTTRIQIFRLAVTNEFYLSRARKASILLLKIGNPLLLAAWLKLRAWKNQCAGKQVLSGPYAS